MKQQGLLSIIVCSNDDNEVTLTYFMAMSNFVKETVSSGFLKKYGSM